MAARLRFVRLAALLAIAAVAAAEGCRSSDSQPGPADAATTGGRIEDGAGPVGARDSGPCPGSADVDGDGHCARTADGSENDCDDYDPAVYPGQNEMCNGKDDDCDLEIDEAPARQCPLSCEMPQGGCDKPTAVVAGSRHSCALTDAGNVYCWGYNSHGQLGTPEITVSAVPLRVPGVDGITQLSASVHGACGLQGDHAICWGAGLKTPYVVALPPDTVTIETGAGYLCALDSGGTVSCAQGAARLSGDFTSRATDAATLIVAGSTACAITTAGALLCWTDRAEPETVISSDVEFAALGADGNACAKVAGQLLCNAGLGTPVGPMTGNESASRVFLSPGIACGMNPQGRVACWLGTAPSEMADVADVAVGDEHGCVLTNAGELKCWGSHNSGALGDRLLDGSVTRDLVSVEPGPLHSLPDRVLLRRGTTPLGACDNVADVQALSDGTGSVHQAAATCVDGCASRLDPDVCVASCLGDLGVSDACARCFTGFAQCQGPGCYRAFLDCVGFPADFMMNRSYMPRAECLESTWCLMEAKRLGEPCSGDAECWSGQCGLHPFAADRKNSETLCMAPPGTYCEEGDAQCDSCDDYGGHCGYCSGGVLVQLMDTTGYGPCALDCTDDPGMCTLGQTCHIRPADPTYGIPKSAWCVAD